MKVHQHPDMIKRLYLKLLTSLKAHHYSNSCITEFRNAYESHQLPFWPCTQNLSSKSSSNEIFLFPWEGLKSNMLLNSDDLIEICKLRRKYPLLSQFCIYPDYQQSKHEDSYQWRKDPCPQKDNTLEDSNNMDINLTT